MTLFGGAKLPLRERVVLCRPEAGLNDLLCQVVKCLEYSVKFNCSLVIDTRSTIFAECLSKYFVFPGGVYPSCYVNELEERANQLGFAGAKYDKYYDEDSRNYAIRVDRGESRTITFDFRLSPSFPLMVHDQCGGGDFGHTFFSHFRPSPYLRTLWSQRLALLPKRYVGVHIRNTDYRTDIKLVISRLEQVAVKFPDVMFYIATDSIDLVSILRARFPRRILSFSRLAQVERGIHNSPIDFRSRANTEALLDLFALAFSSGLLIFPMLQGSYSGFSVLAHFLRESKVLNSSSYL